MSPELRNIRPRQAIAALERAGGIVSQGRGSHMKVEMPNGQILVIPVHPRPLKIGLLRAMIRRAGLTADEFVRLLED